MYQRADEHQESSQEMRNPGETSERRGPNTADIAAAGNRPTIEPETPSNVTPIGSSRAERSSGSMTTSAAQDRQTPLFSQEDTERFRSDWQGIQGGFVDEPRKAVEGADQLVGRTVTRLAEVFAEERSRLEEQWSRGDDVSTEDLRLALQRYRSFFDRLLSV